MQHKYIIQGLKKKQFLLADLAYTFKIWTQTLPPVLLTLLSYQTIPLCSIHIIITFQNKDNASLKQVKQRDTHLFSYNLTYQIYILLENLNIQISSADSEYIPYGELSISNELNEIGQVNPNGRINYGR